MMTTLPGKGKKCTISMTASPLVIRGARKVLKGLFLSAVISVHCFPQWTSQRATLPIQWWCPAAPMLLSTKLPYLMVYAYVTHPFLAQTFLPSNDQMLSYIMGAAVDQKIISRIRNAQLVHLKRASIGPVRWRPAVSWGRVGRRGSEDRAGGPR